MMAGHGNGRHKKCIRSRLDISSWCVSMKMALCKFRNGQIEWNNWVPPRISSFVWRLIQDRIATLPNLKKRNIINQEEAVYCRLCDENEEESTLHLFFMCNCASKVWSEVMKWMGVEIKWSGSVIESLLDFAKVVPVKHKEIWYMIWHGCAWYIWKARNETIFKGPCPSASGTFEKIKFNLSSWIKN